MLSGKVQHLRNLSFGDFIGKDAAFTDTVIVHVQHDLRRFVLILVKEAFEDDYDEFHRCIIVVQNEDPIEIGLLDLLFGARDDAGPGSIVIVIIGPALGRLRPCHMDAADAIFNQPAASRQR